MTVARILAKALNCEKGPTPEPCCECDACRRIATGDDMDVLEIDGASNRGIDEVRQLRQNARLVPSRSRFKIYYIDEVHMLTDPAFNALLKTLEEPPPHVKFIFSTTDPQKLPETIKSRCQRFDFRRISDADIVTALGDVCAKEGLTAEDGALAMLARAARGGMRDALGTLDQLAAMGSEIKLTDVLEVLGAVDRRTLTELVDALAAEDTAGALRSLHGILYGGVDVEDLADQVSLYLRDLLVAACCGPDDALLAGTAVDGETLQRQSKLFTPEQFTYMIQLLREAKLRARRDTTGRVALELAVIKLSRLSQLIDVEEAIQGTAGSLRAGPPQATRTGGDGPDIAAAGPPDQVVTGDLRRMSEKLKNGIRKAPQKPEPQPQGAPAPAATGPADTADIRARQLAACADDPDLAREAMEDEPLAKALAAADGVLGLDPVRLERRRSRADETESDEDEIASVDDE